MKVHDHGLLQVFRYLEKTPLCYDNSKTIEKVHTM
jgi:hypothetical protein